MPTQVLGSHNFLSTPTINNNNIIYTDSSSVPAVSSGTLASRPSASVAGRLYITTDTNKVFRDTGSTWVELIDGTPHPIKQNIYGTIGETTSNSGIPQDNTIPLITEGTQIWSQTFTPSYTGSKVMVSMSCSLDANANYRELVIPIFRDSTCIGVTRCTVSDGRAMPAGFQLVDTSVSTSTVVYSVRIGYGNSSCTWYCNVGEVARYQGLLARSCYQIQEF